MADISVMRLADGRELAWQELGDPNGPPILAFHGTPGSHRQVSFDHDTIAASGVRFIAPDRPGYGHSTFHKGRTLADWAGDVAQLADRLDLASFSVMGVSGGGPHAAACARFLSDRIVGAGIVSGVAPLTGEADGGSMLGINKVIFRLASISPLLVRPVFAGQDFITRHWPEAALRTGVRQLPDADAAVLSRPMVMAAFVEDSRLASRTSAHAAAQDFALFAGDWGLAFEDIAVPVHIWHGDADRNVPESHGRLQAARIPGSVFHPCPGEAHLLVVDHLEEILRTVTQH